MPPDSFSPPEVLHFAAMKFLVLALLVSPTVHDWVDRLNATSTFVIAVFTVFMFLAVRAQIHTSQNTERAWVMTEVIWDTAGGYLLQINNSQMAVDVKVLCKNEGQSPCWIKEIRLKFEVPQKPLPKEPVIESGDVDDWRAQRPLGVGQEIGLKWSPIANGLIREGREGVLYGVVTYRDIFDKERTTTFGYSVGLLNRLVRLKDYPEYNKNT
jgi:hypothetical protein